MMVRLAVARSLAGVPLLGAWLVTEQLIGDDSGVAALGELGQGSHYRGEVPSFEVGIHGFPVTIALVQHEMPLLIPVFVKAECAHTRLGQRLRDQFVEGAS